MLALFWTKNGIMPLNIYAYQDRLPQRYVMEILDRLPPAPLRWETKIVPVEAQRQWWALDRWVAPLPEHEDWRPWAEPGTIRSRQGDEYLIIRMYRPMDGPAADPPRWREQECSSLMS